MRSKGFGRICTRFPSHGFALRHLSPFIDFSAFAKLLYSHSWACTYLMNLAIDILCAFVLIAAAGDASIRKPAEAVTYHHVLKNNTDLEFAMHPPSGRHESVRLHGNRKWRLHGEKNTKTKAEVFRMYQTHKQVITFTSTIHLKRGSDRPPPT